MKNVLIFTLKNEEKHIQALLSSIEVQSKKPDLVVCCDGGSTDKSYELLRLWKPPFQTHLLRKEGNRSIGRNAAIDAALQKYPEAIIAITDVGCVLDTDWFASIIRPFEDSTVDVVAGYYTALAKTSFQKAAAAYMLVMPEHVDPNNFLPATRSMALRSAVWKKLGGFDERYSHNEDYVFAHRLRHMHQRIVFEGKARVFWMPPESWMAFGKQIYRFAFGDTQAGIFRPKVFALFLRYIAGIALCIWQPWLCVLAFFVYSGWAVAKNYRYVPGAVALWILPVMQIYTDILVIIGTIHGCLKRI